MENNVNLVDELKGVMNEKGYSSSSVARALGISNTALSQYLNGIYKGNVAKIDDSVNSFLKRQKEKNKSPKIEIPFTRTSVVKKIFETCRICHLDNELGVCYGNAGVGKTTAIHQYVSENSDVIMIRANLGYTPIVLIRELHKKLGGDGIGNYQYVYNEIVNKIKNSGRLIIIDEAERLPYYSLEALRDIHDEAKIGILLFGMPRLVVNLRGKKGQLAQLSSRVGVSVRLDCLTNEDTKLIVEQVIPGANGICKTFHEYSNGNTRVLTKLISRSVKVAEINKMKVDSDVIQQAGMLLIV